MSHRPANAKWMTVRVAISDWGSTFRLAFLIFAFAAAPLVPAVAIALWLR
jgi:hypothetical protein